MSDGKPQFCGSVAPCGTYTCNREPGHLGKCKHIDMPMIKPWSKPEPPEGIRVADDSTLELSRRAGGQGKGPNHEMPEQENGTYIPRAPSNDYLEL